MPRAISSLLSACAVALALLGAPSQASAVIVSAQFGPTPTVINVGESSTLRLILDIIPDADETIAGDTATINAGDGSSMVFNISGGLFEETVSEDFMFTHIYTSPGEFVPTAVVTIGYLIGRTFAPDLSFTLYSQSVQVLEAAPVPLPAALPLFAGGLGGLGMMGWWRRRKAATC